jgi:hypothetical protein
LEVDDKQIKDAIIKAVEKEGIPEWGERKININLPPHLFIISYCRFDEPYANNSVVSKRGASA